MKHALLLSFCSFALTACMTTGKEIKTRDLNQLAVGKSTYGQIVGRFGAPRMETESEGVCGPKSSGKIVTYDYTSLFKNKTQSILMKFNSKDILCAKPMVATARPF